MNTKNLNLTKWKTLPNPYKSYDIFRTITTETRSEALEIERFLKHQKIYIFNT